MKHQASADRLVIEMRKFLEALEQDETIIMQTGDVLAALEVFTFANFTVPEMEVIFSRARTMIEHQ